MLNTYGYNRKTKEEDDAILAAVRQHYNALTEKGYLVVFTALVGSQNYDLDDKDSDIDTYSLIFPSLSDIARAEDQKAGLFFMSNGYANFKDIRIALNLLRSASPNSIEYFTSKYKVYNPVFESILKEYLEDNTKLWNMIHCNYNHMLYAIAGMAHQLTKRNMPAGKRFSHALRLDDMYYHFMNSVNAGAILEMRPGGNRDMALIAKRDLDAEHEIAYNDQCKQIANKLDSYKDNFHITEEQKQIQLFGLALIDSFQWKLFKKYLMEASNVER